MYVKRPCLPAAPRVSREGGSLRRPGICFWIAWSGLCLGSWSWSCTGPNPAYDPIVDLSGLGPGPGTNDLALDLAGTDLSTCSQGERRCRVNTDAWTSQACQAGKWVDDRRCPLNSECKVGYCTPPPVQGVFEGKACSRENDCISPQPTSPYSCQPFVNATTKAILAYCAKEVGSGLPGTVCKPPDGRGCRSGFCDEIPHSFSGKTDTFCFRSCQVASDCPSTGRFVCSDAKITVEQVVYTKGRSCIPVNG